MSKSKPKVKEELTELQKKKRFELKLKELQDQRAEEHVLDIPNEKCPFHLKEDMANRGYDTRFKNDRSA